MADQGTDVRRRKNSQPRCRIPLASFVVTPERRFSSGTSGDLPQTEGLTAMRFMVMVKATKDSEAGVLPSQEMLEAMGKYNDELVKAGIMLAGEGLKQSSK